MVDALLYPAVELMQYWFKIIGTYLHTRIYTPKRVDALLYAAIKVLQRYTAWFKNICMYIHVQSALMKPDPSGVA